MVLIPDHQKKNRTITVQYKSTGKTETKRIPDILEPFFVIRYIFRVVNWTYSV